ncbi:hypothetical protein FB451DRAFT_1398053 [Mycena latifolia]|nr:hypothetical protein FB451DRAFT_1398053 [Mycena latifolia]
MSSQEEYSRRTVSTPVKSRTQDLLIKQTYTAFVDTPRRQRKWHLIPYFTEESVDRLHCIDDYPTLSSLKVPHGKYISARSVKGRPDHIFYPDDSADAGNRCRICNISTTILVPALLPFPRDLRHLSV